MTKNRFWVWPRGAPGPISAVYLPKDRETGRNGLRIDEHGQMWRDTSRTNPAILGSKETTPHLTETVNR
jgi:hypothetical protein